MATREHIRRDQDGRVGSALGKQVAGLAGASRKADN